MRRDSEQAKRTLAALAKNHDLVLPGRRLEDYSRAKLLPPGHRGLSPEELAAHIGGADLVHTYRPGLPDAAGTAALKAAARGYGCEGLLEALSRVFGPSKQVGPSYPNPLTDEGNRAISAEVTGMQTWLDNGTPGAPPVLAELFQFIFGGAKESFTADAIMDSATAQEETPEQSTASAVETMLAIMYAGSDGLPESPEPIRAVRALGWKAVGPGEDRELDDKDRELDDDEKAVISAAPGLEMAAETAKTADLGALVKGAVFWRSTVFSAPGFATWDPEKLDLVAGMLAPLGVPMANLFEQVLSNDGDGLDQPGGGHTPQFSPGLPIGPA